MKVERLSIPDVMVLEPLVFTDARGFFYEGFHEKIFSDAIGGQVKFVQDNHSLSFKNVLRGLHYQVAPREQGKIIRVVKGEIFDVAVDIRKDSPNFGKWVGEILSSQNKKQMWIPEGFAHGFLTLSDEAECIYKTTDYYAPECDRAIAWNDSDIGIEWPLVNGIMPILSDKDASAKPLKTMI